MREIGANVSRFFLGEDAGFGASPAVWVQWVASCQGEDVRVLYIEGSVNQKGLGVL